jgi:antirestriction protein ArdC
MSSTQQSKSRDVYQEVTDAVLKALDEGTVPWRKPWSVSGDGFGQRNLQSRRPYRGINQVLLEMKAQSAGWDSPYWTTFRAVKKVGGSVRKGERGTLVVFWKRVKVKDEEADGGYKMIPMLRHFTVFNVAQCDGVEIPASSEPTDDPDPFDPIDISGLVLNNYADAPTVEHGGDRAFYRPSADHVQMPEQAAFRSPDAYAHTLFHELAHSTGHQSRLNRDGIMGVHRFGDDDYSREELIAEFGACFLSGSLGVDPDIPQSAAYIRSWRKQLGRDKKLLLAAAGKGQRAADRILGVSFEEA